MFFFSLLHKIGNFTFNYLISISSSIFFSFTWLFLCHRWFWIRTKMFHLKKMNKNSQKKPILIEWLTETIFESNTIQCIKEKKLFVFCLIFRNRFKNNFCMTIWVTVKLGKGRYFNQNLIRTKGADFIFLFIFFLEISCFSFNCSISWALFF